MLRGRETCPRHGDRGPGPAHDGVDDQCALGDGYCAYATPILIVGNSDLMRRVRFRAGVAYGNHDGGGPVAAAVRSDILAAADVFALDILRAELECIDLSPAGETVAYYRHGLVGHHAAGRRNSHVGPGYGDVLGVVLFRVLVLYLLSAQGEAGRNIHLELVTAADIKFIKVRISSGPDLPGVVHPGSTDGQLGVLPPAGPVKEFDGHSVADADGIGRNGHKTIDFEHGGGLV